jgi:hypothetical protein
MRTPGLRRDVRPRLESISLIFRAALFPHLWKIRLACASPICSTTPERFYIMVVRGDVPVQYS